jgi:cell division protease FtsH
LVALALPGGETVQKISIIPRGVAALGYTLQLPTEDRFLMTKSELENKIAVLLGGRVAEELVFHEISTGARDDLLKATEIAKNMVKSYGMSDHLGKVSFDGERQSLFLPGQQSNTGADYSEVTAREIDAEIREILETQYRRATHILRARQPTLREAAAVLLHRETISGDELQAIGSRSQRRDQHEPNGIAVIH